MGDRVNVRAYGEKVAASVVGQLRPKWQELTAKASELEAAKKAERGKGDRGRPEQAAAADRGRAAPFE